MLILQGEILVTDVAKVNLPIKFPIQFFFSQKKEILKIWFVADRSESAKKKKLGQEIGKVAAEKSRGLFR